MTRNADQIQGDVDDDAGALFDQGGQKRTV
jgi:hypothetical protein